MRGSGGGDGPHGKASRRKGTTVERNVTGCRRALFALDPKNTDGRLFMILQLSKVLQGEPEKVWCGVVWCGVVRQSGDWQLGRGGGRGSGLNGVWYEGFGELVWLIRGEGEAARGVDF